MVRGLLEAPFALLELVVALVRADLSYRKQTAPIAKLPKQQIVS